MSRKLFNRAFVALACGAALTASASTAALAAAAPPPGPPATGKAGAPWDLTGTWVSIVNEDWRWRMVTPPKGDYASVPLTPAGKATADTWTEAQDGSCQAYGIGGIMRMPTRLRITWAADDQMKIETDAGVQTRELNFNVRGPAPAGARTLQGYSTAEWQKPALQAAPVAGGIVVGNAFQPPGGVLKVTTTNHTAGWLRKNGVPYSENATVTEYYDRWQAPDNKEWMSVTTVVNDPVNLNGPFFTSSHFRREDDNSKWKPKHCRVAAN
jgi:hypothetical protein